MLIRASAFRTGNHKPQKSEASLQTQVDLNADKFIISHIMTTDPKNGYCPVMQCDKV